MKKSLSFYLLVVLFIPLACSVSCAQTIRDIVQLNWLGQSVQDAAFTDNGKCYLSQSLRLNVYSDNSISGTGTTTMNLSGVIYKVVVKVTGTLYESDMQIYIKDGQTISADALPYDLHWCKGWGTFTIYKNANRTGHYILKGTYEDDCGGTNDAEYLDQ